MVLKRTSCFVVEESSRVGEIRRSVATLASQLGFNEEDETRAAIVATEMANNLVNHATGHREFLLQRIDGPNEPGVEMIAIDRGPGIRNMTDAQRDGFSTAGSAGQGLGAMRRMASVFDIHSMPDAGTVVMARVYAKKSKPRLEQFGALAIPKPGESECGDSIAYELADHHSWFMIADGLGHGGLAAEASAAAVAEFDRAAGESAVRRVERVHEALRATRGAAVAVAEIERGANELTYAGLGNIAGVVLSDKPRNLVSLHGTAGQDNPRITAFPAAWSDTSTLVMHSDGLTARWDAAKFPGLLRRHPSLIAAVLYRDASRGRDDASILVYRKAT